MTNRDTAISLRNMLLGATEEFEKERTRLQDSLSEAVRLLAVIDRRFEQIAELNLRIQEADCHEAHIEELRRGMPSLTT